MRQQGVIISNVMADRSTGNYSEYTVALALFDSVPVVLFFISGLIIYSHFRSLLFISGAAAAFIGGSCKVLWKFIVTAKGRDIAVLTKAFRVLMIGGFALMSVSIIAGAVSGMTKGFTAAVTSMPSGLCFLLGAAGMCAMGWLGAHMDDSARSNWIEESVNAAAQAAILAGLLLL